MIRILFISFVILGLVACDAAKRAAPETLGPYTVWLSHKPDPLKVGYDADFRLLIHNSSDVGVEGCHAALQQFMPGMEMSDDRTPLPMHAEDDGVYTAHSREFTMGGEWSIDLTIDCGDGQLSHTYHYTLEWPQ